MSQNQPSQDLNFDEFARVWKEMDAIEPLTPTPPVADSEDVCLDAYREAAEWDDFMFGGDYDYYESYNIDCAGG